MCRPRWPRSSIAGHRAGWPSGLSGDSLSRVPWLRARLYNGEDTDHPGHGLPDRIHHQDLHGDRRCCGNAGLSTDTPANDYLRAFRLVPVKAGCTADRPAPPDAHCRDWLLATVLGPASPRRWLWSPGRAIRDVAVALLPPRPSGGGGAGTKWMYSNHGFATLGQIVEDVSGQPLDRYLREHIFEPMGMEHTDLTRSERVRSQLATGYSLNSRGLRPVDDREVPAVGGGAAFIDDGGPGALCESLARRRRQAPISASARDARDHV